MALFSEFVEGVLLPNVEFVAVLEAQPDALTVTLGPFPLLLFVREQFVAHWVPLPVYDQL